MLRIAHGWGERRESPRLVVTRSQNRHFERDPKPYRHAAFYLRLGTFGLNCVVHNDHGRGHHKTITYWEWGDWGLSTPLRSPLWRVK